MAIKLKTARSIMEAQIRAYFLQPLGKERPRFMLWSQPGVGKSAVVNAIASKLGLHLEPIIIANYDPTAISGIEFIVNDTTQKIIPDWWPKKGTPTILFFDELPAAAILSQNTVSQLLSEGRAGRFILPTECVIICAGNRRTDRAGTTEMPMHIRNRLMHLEVEPDLADWIDDFASLTNESGQENITAETRAYLRSRPTNFCSFDPMKNVNAWPSPRTWTYADQLFRLGLSDTDLRKGLQGYLGEAVADERMDYHLKAKHMPNINAIYADPHTAAIPKEADIFNTVLEILLNRATHANLGATCIYLKRWPREAAEPFKTQLPAKKPELAKTKEFIAFCAS